MSLKSIKGIIVEIGGDTSGLQKALNSVYKGAGKLSSELKAISKELKFDPKNTELLVQKQAVLNQSIEETANKLKQLKLAQQQADEKIKSGGTISQENYRALQREIINTENKLKQLKLEASNWTKVSRSLDNISSKMKNLGSKITSVGQKMSVITAGLVTVGGIGVKSAMEQESAMQQVKNIYGEASKVIENFAENTAVAYNMSTKEAYKYAQVYGNLIQSITDDEEKNAQYTQQLLKASSVIASSTGRTMEDVMDRIRSGLLGNTEAIEDLGVNVNVALLESTDAFKKFAGDKSWNQLDFQTQQQIRLFGILEQTTKKYGDEVQQNTSTNVQELTAKMQNLGSTLGKKLLPYFNKIVDKATELVDKFGNLSPKTQDLIIKGGMLVAAIGPILIVLGKLISFGGTIAGIASKISGLIAGLTSGTGALSTALTVLTGPVGIVIGVITALIGVFVHLYNSNEQFRVKAQETWVNIVALFQNYVMPVIQNLKNLIITVVNTVIQLVQKLWAYIEPAFNTMLTWLMDFWNSTLSDIVANVMNFINELINLVTMLWNNVISPIVNFLIDTLGPVFQKVFDNIWNKVSGVFSMIGNAVKMVTGVFSGLITFITGVFSGDWAKAWEGIVKVFESIVSGIANIFKTPLNWIIDGINKFIGGINGIKVPDWIPGIGGKGFNIPQIPKLAKGGIVDKATLAMIGEGKSAEAVIPLDRTLTKYMAEAMRQAGGSGVINVNFYPQQMTEAELDRAFNYIDRRYGLAY